MLDYHRVIDEYRPCGFPVGEVVPQRRSMNLGELRGDVGETGREAGIVVAEGPDFAALVGCLDDFMEPFLCCFDFLLHGRQLLPADMRVSADLLEVVNVAV